MKTILFFCFSIINLSKSFLIKPILLHEMVLLQKCSSLANKPEHESQYAISKEIEQLCRNLPKHNRIIDEKDVINMLEDSKWRQIYSKNNLPNYKCYENILNSKSTKLYKKNNNSFKIIMEYNLERFAYSHIKILKPFKAYTINIYEETEKIHPNSKVGTIYKILYLSEKIRINYVSTTNSYEVFYRIFD